MTRTPPSGRTAAIATPPRQLRQFLALDAVVTGGNGLGYVFLAEPLESLLGVSGDLLHPVGAFLVVYGTAVAGVAGRANVSRAATRAIIVANGLWAAGSLLALTLGALSPTLVGGLWIAVQAVVVGGFAAAQNWALRRLR
ncbi:MAG: hypothetical protein M3381_03410 [Actinomycetota bacterium]|nr:hypothetical protein [Actinomycetota bacterium]